MTLEKLPKTTKSSKKRLGRGYGSGKGGHTAGRGQKGQKTRGKLPLYFEGSKMRKSLIRRLPMLRGKMRFKSVSGKPIILNLKHLNLLPKGTLVDVDALIKHGLLEAAAARLPVKILGDGELTHPLTVALPTSKSAAKKIEKAGGKVVAK
ncbi:50S ribosomal protein L15 [Patescibacteria group bacterium]|nr:50S ribosomal protein L15 [Patescibacteria group bacterium]